MPAPRQMRYAADDGSSSVTVDERIEEVKALVAMLRSGTDEEKGLAALGVYNMTSFASAVSIDDPKALTSYDKKVFGHGEEGAGEDGDTKAGEPGSDSETPPESKAGEDELGEQEHVDGKRYMMGDGFMLMEDKEGGKEARRVAVTHSRKCLDNRVLIGSVAGIFESLVEALETGSMETRWQVLFRNATNKERMGSLPAALPALATVMHEALQAKDTKCLAEACRALGVLVSGVRANQQAVAGVPQLLATLHRTLQEGEGEAPGQAGKVLNSVSHLLPEPT